MGSCSAHRGWAAPQGGGGTPAQRAEATLCTLLALRGRWAVSAARVAGNPLYKTHLSGAAAAFVDRVNASPRRLRGQLAWLGTGASQGRRVPTLFRASWRDAFPSHAARAARLAQFAAPAAHK